MSEITLREELATLPPDLRAHLGRAGFDAERLVRSRRRSGRAAGGRGDRQGRAQPGRGVVEPPARTTSPTHPCRHRRARAPDRGGHRGNPPRRAGVLRDGGRHGHPHGRRRKGAGGSLRRADFLDLRLRENATWSRRAGRPVPLWLMTSEATDAPIREALRAGRPAHVATFTQDLGLRLTPEGALFRGRGRAAEHVRPRPRGSARRAAPVGLLSSVRGRGGKHVWIANLDNLGRDGRRGAARAVHRATGTTSWSRSAPKVAGDRGGIPVVGRRRGRRRPVVRRLQVLEEFRLPTGFDAGRRARLQHEHVSGPGRGRCCDARIRWTWFEVEKKVGERTAVQFERLLQELTAALPAAYVRVPRDGSRGALPARSRTTTSSPGAREDDPRRGQGARNDVIAGARGERAPGGGSR